MQTDTKFNADATIHCGIRGNFANYMIKYMAAVKLAEEIGGAQFSNYEFPDFDINFPSIEPEQGSRAEFRDDMRIDLMRVKYLLKNGVKNIVLNGHYQRMENYPTILRTRELFPIKQHLGIAFGDNYIVCPVRGGEILGAIHSGYTLIPVEFYKDILSRENATPVFMGQTDKNIYTDALRKAFPDAVFLPSQGPMADFMTIRKSRKIVLPVSTFAWLAAWLSDATKIVLPVFGLYNFHAHPENDLLPVFDDRYVFYRFPVQAAVDISNFEEAHKELEGRWKLEPPHVLLRL